MVTLPKTTSRFCSHCSSHQEHTITQYKTGKTRKDSQGKRRFLRNHDEPKKLPGDAMPVFEKKSKCTKNLQLNFTCKTCKHIHKEDAGRYKFLDIKAKEKKVFEE